MIFLVAYLERGPYNLIYTGRHNISCSLVHGFRHFVCQIVVELLECTTSVNPMTHFGLLMEEIMRQSYKDNVHHR